MGIELPPDFKEFLRLLRSHGAKYLLIGGYAVCFHGRPRATEDMDIWVARNPENAQKVVDALTDFGFGCSDLSPNLFIQNESIVRMGVPPIRLEIFTDIPGVDFDECYGRRVVRELDGLEMSIIGLEDLKVNKRASGRYRDLADLDLLD